MKPTVAIVGLGLMGGSLGQALRHSKQYRVIGIARKNSTLQQARRMRAFDQGFTDIRNVREADIVVVAVPVDQIVPIIKRLQPHLKPGAVVTDVGSVKRPIIREISKRINFVGGRPAKSPYFVGAHPLAGTHQSGIQAARPDLYKRASCVIVRNPRGSENSVAKMWKVVGARPILMSASAHDRAVALVSHLPHALAHAMVHLIMRTPTLLPLLAGSFRDVTRVASSDARQWMEIMNANASEISSSIRQFQKELTSIRKKLGTRGLGRYLKKSQLFRLALFQSK